MTLAVTTSDLRVGQGYVRCGRCGNVFNALLSLSEEPSPAEPGANAGPGANFGAPPADSLSSTALNEELSEAAAQPPPEDPPSVEPDPATVDIASSEAESPDAESRDAGTGTFETIVLEGDAITQTEEVVPQAEYDQEMSVFALQPAPGETPEMRVDDALPAEFADHPFAAERARVWPWLSGAVVLLVLLGLQMVHHWRNEIATQPMWYGPLTRLYASLGMPLSPHWDLNAYDLRQQGANSEGSVIHIALSLANRGQRAQPLPDLRLTLLDRYGKPLATRNLQPPEYLPRSMTGESFMQADQRIDTQIDVQDPGSEPASFELDACLQQAGGGMRCANDNPLLPGG